MSPSIVSLDIRSNPTPDEDVHALPVVRFLSGPPIPFHQVSQVLPFIFHGCHQGSVCFHFRNQGSKHGTPTYQARPLLIGLSGFGAFINSDRRATYVVL